MCGEEQRREEAEEDGRNLFRSIRESAGKEEEEEVSATGDSGVFSIPP